MNICRGKELDRRAMWALYYEKGEPCGPQMAVAVVGLGIRPQRLQDWGAYGPKVASFGGTWAQ